MNKYAGTGRKRNQTLLVVEGEHEKNELFWLIFRCFPEMNIEMENVWIYGTNIYLLYEDIVREYGSDWADEEMDIDLPFVISKKRTPENLRYKDDFTNIILVFDYERHDTHFSEGKIMDMQKAFADAADIGKLYINYPMIESYQDLKVIPDAGYSERKIPVSLQPGSKYKNQVAKDSVVKKVFDFPHRVDDLLKEHYGIADMGIRRKCCEDILNFSDGKQIENRLQEVLQNVISDDRLKTVKYQLKDWINKVKYADSGNTYWQYARNFIVQIILHNLRKANLIQNGRYDIAPEQYKEYMEQLDLAVILWKQNHFSSTATGFIWVLNTCVFVVADYNFSLVEKKNQSE